MPRIDDFINALNLAREKLPPRDPEEMCRNAGAELFSQDSEIRIIFPFFLKKVEVSYPGGIVAYLNKDDKLSIQEQGLILHYLLNVREPLPTGELITFREIPSGEFYYQSFQQRAQSPLVKTFGSSHELFHQAGKMLGGHDAAMGDASLTFLPFPKIPITLVLWKGDEEFPPDGNILFDLSIKHILQSEDIAFLAGTVVYKLIAYARN